MEIVGKRNRKVPVLLTKDMRDAIDILVAKRSDTLANNRYLFAAPTTENGYLKGWDALKFTTANANLVRPDLITTTNMRKYVATVSQVIFMIFHYYMILDKMCCTKITLVLTIMKI